MTDILHAMPCRADTGDTVAYAGRVVVKLQGSCNEGASGRGSFQRVSKQLCLSIICCCWHITPSMFCRLLCSSAPAFSRARLHMLTKRAKCWLSLTLQSFYVSFCLRPGDYIVPSGLEDGTAVASPPRNYIMLCYVVLCYVN
jgi:hypothetical protein